MVKSIWKKYEGRDKVPLDLPLMVQVTRTVGVPCLNNVSEETEFKQARFYKTKSGIMGIIGGSFDFDVNIVCWREFPKGFFDLSEFESNNRSSHGG